VPLHGWNKEVRKELERAKGSKEVEIPHQKKPQQKSLHVPPPRHDPEQRGERQAEEKRLRVPEQDSLPLAVRAHERRRGRFRQHLERKHVALMPQARALLLNAPGARKSVSCQSLRANTGARQKGGVGKILVCMLETQMKYKDTQKNKKCGQ
jgi:hypothetical protein